MPRPKVPAHQRQRAAEACNFCREAKKKCSGISPCNYCLRRGSGSSCVMSSQRRNSTTTYDTNIPGSAPSSAPAPAPATFLLERPSPIAIAISALSQGDDRDFQPLSPSESRTTDGDVAGPGSLPRQPSPRMLRSLRGERVYIGQGASLSFLQLVRGIVAEQIGPSQFSHNEKSDTMLEKETPNGSNPSPFTSGLVDLDAEQKVAYSKSYLSATQGLIDILEPSALDGLLSNETHSANPQKQALLNLVIAIGAQGDPSSSDRDIGLAYFRQTQLHAFTCMLEDPSLDMVRTFLLMAYYLLGDCRRNTAFMYLGIATRAAVALGFHSRDSYADMANPQTQLRLRVWMSLRILDMLCNAILGRPAATAGLHFDLKPILDSSFTSKTSPWIYLIASYNIVTIINTIVERVYEKKEITIPVVEQLLQEIELWSRELPKSLRNPSGQVPAQGETVGKVYVSCLYYFAVTLVTRPILISTLTAQQTGEVDSHLASACLDAAMFLIQTCVDAHRENLVSFNMCILKALIFPAGLVLGFESFAKRNADYNIETAFHGAREILSFMATQSPQAAHYFEILTSLSNAVTERRGRVASSVRSRYVSRLFSFDSERNIDHMPLAPSTDDQSQQMANILPEWSPDDGRDVFLDWDSLNISQWDNFPYLP